MGECIENCYNSCYSMQLMNSPTELSKLSFRITFEFQTSMTALITLVVTVDRVLMVSTVSPVAARQDILEIIVRLVGHVNDEWSIN